MNTKLYGGYILPGYMVNDISIVYHWLRRSEWYGLYFVSRERREWYEEGIVSSTIVGSPNGDVSFSTGC